MFSFCLTIPTKNSIHHQLHHLNDRCIFYRCKRKKIHRLAFWVYSLFTRCFIKLIYTAAQVRNTLMLIWNLYFLSLEHWFFEIQHYQMNSWITSITHLSCLNLANLLSLYKLYQSTLLNKKQHEYVHRRKWINVLGSYPMSYVYNYLRLWSKLSVVFLRQCCGWWPCNCQSPFLVVFQKSGQFRLHVCYHLAQ